MVHQQLQAHSAWEWLGFSQLPFRLYQDSCICLNLQLWATNPCADLTGNRCTPQLAWSIPVTKCTWYLSDAVWTIRIQLFTNLFLEGRLGFIILLAALSSAGLMLWRHSATKLGCPRKIRLEIKVISLFFRTWPWVAAPSPCSCAGATCTRAQTRELTAHSLSCCKCYLMYIPISSHSLS